jgi:hypothetical protein
VGAWPEILNGSHMLFDEGDGNRNRIFDVIREEMNAVNLENGYKYTEKCCKNN